MSAAWAIIWFIVTLTFLIFIHEMGHFITAKRSGVKVLEFGIGLPPRIWGKKWGGTLYSINWIPIGGFCKMLGEEDPSEEGSLASKSPLTRLMVLSAGSIVMLIFPIILFTFVYMLPHNEPVALEGIEIVHVEKDTPAYFAGMQPEDEILSINGTPVKTIDELKELTAANKGKDTTFLVQRGEQQIEMQMIPREEYPQDQGPLGIGITYIRIITERESYPPWTAVRLGFEQNWDIYVALKDGVKAMISDEIPFEPGGVIAAGQVTTEIAERGSWEDLMFWAGLLSINLGIINLLPLPALDGGRIAFVLLEIARRGKRISPEKEGMVHLIGFLMLIGFILLIAYQDIVRVIQGESLLP